MACLFRIACSGTILKLLLLLLLLLLLSCCIVRGAVVAAEASGVRAETGVSIWKGPILMSAITLCAHHLQQPLYASSPGTLARC